MPPDRGEYLIRGGYVLSVDPDVGDVPGGAVHVVDGEIADVGHGLEPATAEVIDATDCIVMPGFVEVHWHMWNSVWRGLAHDAVQYFGLHRLAPAHTPEDHHTAVSYAALEAVNAGVTTCHDWANGIREFADAEAEMRALVASGLRARFSYGDGAVGSGDSIGTAELERALRWTQAHGDGRLGLGIAIGNAEAFADEVAAARALGLPIAPHTDLSAHVDLLGPDVLYSHGAGASSEVVALVAATRMKVALCPSTDPLIGAGMSPVQRLVAGGVHFEDMGFSVDVSCQTPVDPFASMRLLLFAARMEQRGETSFDEVVAQDLFGSGPATPLMRPRQVIELATLNGARVLGLDDITGSLTPGKRADMILIRTDALNMLPAAQTNASFQVVQSAQPANVDTVIADGRVLKRHGRLVGVDVAAVVARAAAAQAAIRERAGFPVLDLME
jgi:5-methylthioadenosine/S-adenosylhomocysteine deaminase